MTLARCYNATVNESETITEAQPFCPVGSREAGPWRASGFGLADTPQIERS